MCRMPVWCAFQMARWLQVLIAILAVISAVLWGLASRVKTPTDLTYESAPALMRAVAKQSHLNAWAARLAALAALCQVGAVLVPGC